MIEAVSGGGSVLHGIGSALSMRWPSLVWMANLYRSPAPMPGIKTSQMPVEPKERMGYCAAFQPQKSPTTETPAALEAHTTTAVPGLEPSSESKVLILAPSTSHRRSWRPSEIRCKSKEPKVGRNR